MRDFISVVQAARTRVFCYGYPSKDNLSTAPFQNLFQITENLTLTYRYLEMVALLLKAADYDADGFPTERLGGAVLGGISHTLADFSRLQTCDKHGLEYSQPHPASFLKKLFCFPLVSCFPGDLLSVHSEL